MVLAFVSIDTMTDMSGMGWWFQQLLFSETCVHLPCFHPQAPYDQTTHLCCLDSLGSCSCWVEFASVGA